MQKKMLEKLRTELEIRNFSRATIKSYISSVERFLDFNQDQEINEDLTKHYIQKRLQKIGPAGASHDIFAIQFFAKNVLGKTFYIPRPKRNKTLPDILTRDEAQKLVNTPSNIKHKLILKLLYGCGLRVSEIVNINKKDVNLPENLIHIRMAKGKKDRFVKIPESIKKELESYCHLNSEEFLFPSNRGGKLSTATIQAKNSFAWPYP